MPGFRKLLYPLSVAYDKVTALRNSLFDRGYLPSREYPFPVIAVGNLSAGGTGKSPMTEYLARLLGERYKIAVLSRGYGRKTSGYRLAGPDDNAAVLGDEPYQIHVKFPEVAVAVCGDRRHGIDQLAATVRPDVIILDDAYQHRYVKAGLYILLTSYGDLFADDQMLPAGNLREHPSGKKRAHIIVVTKCPQGIGRDEMERIRMKIDPLPSQKLFFSFIEYAENVQSDTRHIPVEQVRLAKKTLFAGIAKPEPFFDYLKGDQDTLLRFADHHDFSAAEIRHIMAGPKPVVTTEKDYARLRQKVAPDMLYYLPIRQSFVTGAERFDQSILDFCKSFDR